jgi:uncharacterized protein (DUF362 family)
MGKSFVNATSVFQTASQRNLNYLSQIYKDSEKLFDILKQLSGDILNAEKIAGKSVLIKPNLVLDPKTEDDKLCMNTHESFILASIRMIMEMGPKLIILGDGPVQSCNMERILNDEFSHEINHLSSRYGIEVIFKDFRTELYNIELNKQLPSNRSLEDYIVFNLGEDSYLDAICDDIRKPFRVSSYNPDKMVLAHKKGFHKYYVARELFDSDIVITLPKIKTHKKSGLSSALKILVGITGRRDLLPHYRIGSIASGGDSYANGNVLRALSENVLDYANRHINSKKYKLILKLSQAIWRISVPKTGQNLGGDWYGNDTTWRMVLDINRIAVYGSSDGTLSDMPQREIFNLCDGIIAGQGEGPLNPEPLPLGIVVFSNDASLNDRVVGRLMGMKTDRIPLLQHAANSIGDLKHRLFIKGEQVDVDMIDRFVMSAKMPVSWIGYDK